MTRILYSLAWYLALPLVLARLWWRGRKEPGYRAHWAERLGFPDAVPSKRLTLWVHAVSVGETRAAEPLVEALLKDYPDSRILLTHMTPTGRATGKSLFGHHGERVVQSYLPYDLGAMVARFLRRHQPRAWKGDEVRAHMTALARELGKIAPWVRLHYVYPYPHVDQVIPLMAEGLILPYLDIPFQHASPSVLKSMKRPANQVKVLERLRAWREICPDIAIRSSFVVGFPGETEADFDYLLDWLDEAQLDRVGAFRFEPVAGAAANDLPGHVPEEVKEERYARIMEKTAAISAAKLQAKVGRTLDVIIDVADGEGGATGRSYADAPEIDGEVHLRDAPHLKAGDIVPVLIEDADEHDLFGVPAQ